MNPLWWLLGIAALLLVTRGKRTPALTDDEILANRRRAAIDKANREQDRRERKRMGYIETAYHLDREVRWNEWN